MRREVFISGCGAVTPFGRGADRLMEAIASGVSALGPPRRLRDAFVKERAVAEIPDDTSSACSFAARPVVGLAEAAASEALEDAHIRRPEALGLVLSTTKADMSGVVGDGSGLGSPRRLADELAHRLGIRGPRAAYSCACASGVIAIAMAARWVASRVTDTVLVVGVDVLNRFIVRGFESLLALSSAPCRPFDVSRKGLSLGEGAAALVLSANGGAAHDIRIGGWGGANDANHLTGPSRDGSGLRLAAGRALHHAGLAASDVDYIHLHGTGTAYNDAMEAKAMVALFGGRTPPASGTKGQTGHTLGTAGVLECLIAMETLKTGTAPANARLMESGVDLDLDLVIRPRRLVRHRIALKVSAGFGGIDAAVVLVS